MKSLQEIVERTQQIVDKVEEDLHDQAVKFDYPVETARDANGRYLLLDAYVALLGAQTALENPILAGGGPNG